MPPRKPQKAMRRPSGDQVGCTASCSMQAAARPARRGSTTETTLWPRRASGLIQRLARHGQACCPSGDHGGVVAGLRDLAARLAGRAHDEDPAALALGAEGDLRPVGREGGLGVVDGGVRSQVDGVGSAHALEMDVEVAAVAAHEQKDWPSGETLG